MLEEFAIYLIEKDRSKKTIETYSLDVSQFMDYYKKDIFKLRKADIVYYKQYLKDKHYHIKTINKKLTSLKQYINFLNSEYDAKIYIPVQYEKIQSQEYLEDVITDEDFDKLIKTTKECGDIRAMTIFYTLYLTGVRVSELLQLKVYDIEKDYITICGKGNKYRDIFVSQKLKRIWKEYLPYRINSNEIFLFTSSRGTLTRFGVNYIVKKYAHLSGVNPDKIFCHNLRHLYGLSLAKKGFSLDVIADLMGHSSVNITRIYTRRSKKELLEAINQL